MWIGGSGSRLLTSKTNITWFDPISIQKINSMVFCYTKTRTMMIRSLGAYIRLELHPYDPRNHCSRCWNLLYMYKEDLPWVWTGRGVSIISTNRDSYLKSKHNILRSLGAYIRLELHPYDPRSHCSRCWNLLYIYKEDLPWVWTVWGFSIISTNRDSYL